ncbi:MAG: hypothetical protein ACOYL6_14940 [Bacteriovoracaceae bacterium]
MKMLALALILSSLSTFAQQASTGNAQTDLILATTQCADGGEKRLLVYKSKQTNVEKDDIAYGRTSFGDVVVVDKNKNDGTWTFNLYLCKDSLTSKMDLEVGAVQVLNYSQLDSKQFIGNIWIKEKDPSSIYIKLSFYGATEIVTEDKKIPDSILYKKGNPSDSIGVKPIIIQN